MAENTKIEWADHTFNPWVGCEKISPACKNCYAESWAKRTGQSKLRHGERRRTSAANWELPLKWNKEAEGASERPRVFCASLADVFEDHPAIDPQWRDDLFAMIDRTPNLDWLLLTKRPENISRLWPWGFYGDQFSWQNAWIGTTAENQEQANKRIPELLEIPAKVRFLSCEPLLGDVSLTDLFLSEGRGLTRELNALTGHDRINWVIAGGESGPNARPSHVDWFRNLRDQCEEANVPFFFKQNGEWVPTYVSSDTEVAEGEFRVAAGDIDLRSDGTTTGAITEVRFPTKNTRRDGRPLGVKYEHYVEHDDRLGAEQSMRRVGKKAAGRILDGREWNELPRVK